MKNVSDYLPPAKTVPLFSVYMTDTIEAPLMSVLNSGYIGQGPKVEEFENKLADYLGNKNVVTLNSGTSALHLALRLAGVSSKEDEVITTPMTCTATNLPILANNGKIVWADIDASTGLIDPIDVERKITPKTKAIMAVDWGGMPVDMDKLMEIGKKYNVKVIQDSAHAFGSKYKNKMVGTLADYTCFSFQAIKHMTTVDGGLLAVKDSEDYKRAKLLRWYGIDRDTERKDFRCEEDIKEWGYKFHMNDVNATIGIEQLKKVDETLKKCRDIAEFYNQNIDLDYYRVPQVKYETNSSYWLYTVILPSQKDRLNFMKHMKEKNIMTSQVHARNDTHTTFKEYAKVLPGVTEFTEKMVCVPIHRNLSQEQVERVLKEMNNFANLQK